MKSIAYSWWLFLDGPIRIVVDQMTSFFVIDLSENVELVKTLSGK